ncbi:MAG: NAD-dependent epimerase/dehydratase family protein, partial [Bdellovibrionales bacterium]|nr:NAD-dependent epimerase/dehydratase family protein [Bdellovibrionales bacterium]NQZ18175.1 NAD-dependent epimerase/dehydratase family protein [Bdellovibrionales bacterium]
MSRNVLIIGGSRFFGRHLTESLVQRGDKVTLVTRGNIDVENLGLTDHIICDRDNKDLLDKSLNGKNWDIIFDQVCYDYQRAKEACELFSDRVGKYIFTSTKSVYDCKANLVEEDFDPTAFEVEKLVGKDENYGLAKRQAEVGFVRYAKFPVIMVRFPIVVGFNDYTQRLAFHIDRIKNGEPIYFPNVEARISFIEALEAARTLEFLGDSDLAGPINAASPDAISLKSFVARVEMILQKKANLIPEFDETIHSPYGIPDDWFMSCQRLTEEGLTLSPV